MKWGINKFVDMKFTENVHHATCEPGLFKAFVNAKLALPLALPVYTRTSKPLCFKF